MDTLTVPGVVGSLPKITNYVGEVAHEVHLDYKASQRLRLAVDEIATNICLHGYKSVKGDITLETKIDDQHVAIILQDTASAFNPLTVEMPDMSIPVEQRGLGGMGIYLARQNVDKFLYERIGDCNRTILIINRPQ